jgi:hypothetical protein
MLTPMGQQYSTNLKSINVMSDAATSLPSRLGLSKQEQQAGAVHK